MSEVMRWQLKGFIPGVQGMSQAVLKPWVVLASDYDAVLAREAALQQLLNEKDQRLDELNTAFNESQEELVRRGKTLAEAVVVVSSQEWQWKPYDDYYHRDCGYYCPCCGVEEGSKHESSCDIGSFLAVAASPDDACAHSHANRLGCPECGEEFSGDEVKP